MSEPAPTGGRPGERMTGSIPAGPVIGRTRARFRMHWPWYTRAVLLLLPVVIGCLILLTGDVLAAGISALLVFVLARA